MPLNCNHTVKQMLGMTVAPLIHASPPTFYAASSYAGSCFLFSASIHACRDARQIHHAMLLMPP